MKKKIKLLVMDVDGTMTDGKLYISHNGELFKIFDVKDGMGIKIAKNAGIITAIITGKKSDIVSYRSKELGIDELCQGVDNKNMALSALLSKYQISSDSVAYVGDDINDVPAMQSVGLSFAPSDAVPEVLQSVDIQLKSKGGCGAIRECVQKIIEYNESLDYY